jgi:hypothetical protein
MRNAGYAAAAALIAFCLGWLLWGRTAARQDAERETRVAVPAARVTNEETAKVAPTLETERSAPPPAKPPLPPVLPPPMLRGAQRSGEPPGQAEIVESVIRPKEGYAQADVDFCCNQVRKLSADALTLEEKAALRWYLFESQANETIRNDVGFLLVAAKDGELAGALAAQRRDPKQSAVWRNYCAQLLAADYEQNQPQPEILEELFLGLKHDPEDTVRDGCLLHLSRLAETKVGTAQEPALRERLVKVTEELLTGKRKPSTTMWISAIRAAGRLGLKEKTAALRNWMNDEQAPLGVRYAAADELGRAELSPEESVRAEVLADLQAMTKTRDRILRETAERSWKKIVGPEKNKIKYTERG